MDKLIQDTQRERERMLTGGMEQWSKRRLIEELAALGYAITKEPGCSFSYVNRGNEIHYKARSVFIIEIKSGLHFCNINAGRDKLPELQAIRRGVFCFERGRIWEL